MTYSWFSKQTNYNYIEFKLPLSPVCSKSADNIPHQHDMLGSFDEYRV